MKEMESENPSDFIHKKETTIEKILSFFKTLDGLLLIGKHNFGHCSVMNKCKKCQQICSQMSEKIIPDEVMAELVHTGKDVTDNPWIGDYGIIQICKHTRDCSECESKQIQNRYSENEISSDIFRITDKRTGESWDEIEVWAAGAPYRVKLD